MELYIKSTGIVSAAGTNNQVDFPIAPVGNMDKMLCAEPDYTGMIPPMQLRRMSKAVRIGIAASKVSMAQAGIEKPDAISIGTAMGCLQDTEFFLNKMVEQDEQMLTPTSFIQSTHNTVSGQIALLAGCYGHNLTFVQRGHSFEHAMINASLYLNDHAGENILAGGIDELTDNSVKALQLGGVYKSAENSSGATAGEGAAFFILSDAKEGSLLCVNDIHCFTTKETTAAIDELACFLKRNDIADNVDAVCAGKNGDAMDSWYDSLQSSTFNNIPFVDFKNYSGEYATASSFALGMITNAVRQGHLSKYGINENAKNIIIVNHYMHYYSYWYLQIV